MSEPMEPLPGQVEPPQPAGNAISDLFENRRLLLFLIILIAELVIFGAGLSTPLSSQTQQTLENQTNTQFASVPTATPFEFFLLVFPHNLSIALVEMVPLLGAFIFAYSIYATGLVAQVIATSGGLPGWSGAIIFVFPDSIVELSAYAIAVGSWVMLLLSLRSHTFRRELKVFALEIISVVLVLLVAAIMETATRSSFVLGFGLWLPTGLAVAAIILVSRRSRAWVRSI